MKVTLPFDMLIPNTFEKRKSRLFHRINQYLHVKYILVWYTMFLTVLLNVDEANVTYDH
jgi:hypothetical protein